MSVYKWNPWHGCHKLSDGCRNCYVFYLDALRGRDANVITKSKSNFELPLKKDKSGTYKIPAGVEVDTCFTSDFFIEEADQWRADAWDIIRKRNDVRFLIPTKRIDRISKCLPSDWDKGYENVVIAASIENSASAKDRLTAFLDLSIKHKYIFVCPVLEYVDLRKYLETNKIELVSVGGESYENARVCDFEWVKKIYDDCERYEIPFLYHQSGSNVVVNGRHYCVPHEKEFSQAKRAMKMLKSGLV